MKKIFTLSLASILSFNVFSQNVGIGTTAPVARLHVQDSNVVFTGPLNLPATTNFNPAIQGAGTRMLWYPQKGAFRIGIVDGSQWDKDNIGRFSFATGYDTKAAGEGSFASGSGSIASGPYSTAIGNTSVASADNTTSIGFFSTASGITATAIGSGNLASGPNSMAIGYSNTASGNTSTVFGAYNTASANFAMGMGYGGEARGAFSTTLGAFGIASGTTSAALGAFTTAAGDRSTSMGSFTTAEGHSSTAMGLYTKAKSPNSLVIGSYNDTIAYTSLFEIGNGSADNARKNAMTVLSNGNVGIGLTSPSHLLHVNNGSVRIEGPINSGGSAPALSMGGFGDISIDKPGGVGGRFIIKENGNVGIGKANPSMKLDISLSPSGSSYHASASIGIEKNATHYLNLITNNSSETGIIFGNALSSADGGIIYRPASGTDARSLYFRVADITKMILSPNGNTWIGGSLSQSSDARLKKNIVPLSNSLASLQQLKGYSYNWKDENRDSAPQIGLIAQELQKVYPQLVKENSNGELSVNYISLIPVLIEGMKEQQKQIEELKLAVKKLNR